MDKDAMIGIARRLGKIVHLILLGDVADGNIAPVGVYGLSTKVIQIKLWSFSLSGFRTCCFFTKIIACMIVIFSKIPG